jgi:phage-related protein/DNA-binding XRE family transcriptional regulator
MMLWKIEPLNETVEQELTTLTDEPRARFVHISELLQQHGPLNVSLPHVDRIQGSLWEMRMRSKAGIARAIYMPARIRRIVVMRVFETRLTERPQLEIELALERAGKLATEPKAIKHRAIKDLHEEWMEKPGYANAYTGLEPEIELASAIICARTQARLTQDQLAERMDTTRMAIARLESGKTIPSTRVLKQIGCATGLRFRISFKGTKTCKPKRART